MRYGRNLRTFLLPDLEDLGHKRNRVVLLKPFRDRTIEHRGCEGTEAFAPFDLRVQDLFHVRTSGIADDRTIAKRPWSPLHSPLKPADDLAFRNRLRDTSA